MHYAHTLTHTCANSILYILIFLLTHTNTHTHTQKQTHRFDLEQTQLPGCVCMCVFVCVYLCVWLEFISNENPDLQLWTHSIAHISIQHQTATSHLCVCFFYPAQQWETSEYSVLINMLSNSECCMSSRSQECGYGQLPYLYTRFV